MQMEVDKSSKQRDNSKPRQTHISPELANQAINDAITYSGGDVVVMARTCASGFCDALQQCYGSEEISDVFIACGSGLNGLIGLQVAVELQKRGYAPAVYAAEQSKHANFRSVCDEAGIDLHDFIPSTLEFYYDIVVDALLGTGFDGGDIRQQYWTVYEMLISTRLAIVSLDVPSGWDLSTGPRKIDVTADSFIKPEVLVSLEAPKLGSNVFAGGYHFIAGRHLPQSYFWKRESLFRLFPARSQTACSCQVTRFASKVLMERHMGDLDNSMPRSTRKTLPENGSILTSTMTCGTN
ncbi:unnamed protein product [Chondrus crispus]|uniref:NAD(P)H-hydrate epimerase n=1 Tax=Chondrus crispus TaxID=2769 RepID=R7QNE0_CHOCR|nr:unnamed protein product [Chondrus crispus]CDF39619.1 unnamed protein product [Chondrus crispus]|eukprot:XP_005709913.1 unnamed protein product [Chondrus crispus]